MRLILAIFISSLIVSSISADVIDWHHQTYLDPVENYHLKWFADESNEVITFEVEAKTRGWIGLGVSPNGGMQYSDVVIGWVDADGKANFHDRYAEGEFVPRIDDEQDWKLISASENATHTTMRFSRPFVTCDDKFDRPITPDTMRIIYAYGDDDPPDVNQIKMHRHHQRGSKNLILIGKSQVQAEIEEDVKIIDMTVNNLVIPAKNTTYWCKIFKLGSPKKKMHVVKYAPLITPGNEPFTHHFVASFCTHPDQSRFAKYTGVTGDDCTDIHAMPQIYLHCRSIIFVWLVGGEPVVMPQEAGLPLGGSDGPEYIMLESHYDNPDLVAGKVDSSGFRLYVTEKLRKYDSAVLNVGMAINFQTMIPPGVKNYQLVGHCHPKCFENLIPDDGLKVYAALPHAHLLGRKIRTRHFRDGKELPWILNDEDYDFNTQQFRTFKEPLIIKYGDQITTECTFDSTDRKTATIGGQSTRDEMCQTFMAYYPKMKTNNPCYSGLLPGTVMSISGVEQISNYEPDTDPQIVLPQNLANQTLNTYLTKTKTDWDMELIDNSRHLVKNAKMRPTCYVFKSPFDNEINELIGYPDIDKPYQAPKIQCQKSGGFLSLNDQMSMHNNTGVLITAGIIVLALLATGIWLFKSKKSSVEMQHL